jgi:TatD DNase family protein
MNLEEYHLVDTHAHICDEIFDSDRSEVIAQAKEAGIVQIVAVGENLEDARKNLTFLDLGQAQEMRQFIRDHKGMIGAIGEVGLDFWKVQDKEDQQRQQEIFSGFIGLSLELGLPLNVHSRSAGREAIWFLLDHGADKVQMHAFDAKATSALPGVEAGFFFSIPPSVVRSRQKQKLVKKLPLEALLLETDSPVLGPEPHSRNVPANALVSAKAIAEIKQVPLQEVLEMVTENFKCLYRA